MARTIEQNADLEADLRSFLAEAERLGRRHIRDPQKFNYSSFCGQLEMLAARFTENVAVTLDS